MFGKNMTHGRKVKVGKDENRPKPDLQQIFKCCGAARQTGHSYMAQHFCRQKCRCADVADVRFLVFADAASLRACSMLIAALQITSPVRPFNLAL